MWDAVGHRVGREVRRQGLARADRLAGDLRPRRDQRFEGPLGFWAASKGFILGRFRTASGGGHFATSDCIKVSAIYGGSTGRAQFKVMYAAHTVLKSDTCLITQEVPCDGAPVVLCKRKHLHA